jgi:hypothetical protein
MGLAGRGRVPDAIDENRSAHLYRLVGETIG